MYGRRTAMQETKLTVRVPRDLLENFKRYAANNNTTLTNLIEAYLRAIPAPKTLENAPIVRKLSGSLSQGVSVKDYRKHLEDKYGG
jgi:post-segregation antitoxin (ccd killing protein)